MKRQLIFTCTLVFLTTFLSAQVSITEQSKEAIPEKELNFVDVSQMPTTVLRFDETIYEFGQVQQGEVVEHIYRFTNAGDEPLLLSNVRGSCGCTVPNYTKEAIEPGGTGAIVVHFDTKGKMGMQHKQVTVTANTDPPQTIVYIKGEVLSEETKEEVTSPSPREIAPIISKPEINAVSVYPNPSDGKVWLNMGDAVGQSASIEVYNGNGHLVNKIEVPSIGTEPLLLDATEYASGTYWLSAKIGDAQRVNLPFVVSK